MGVAVAIGLFMWSSAAHQYASHDVPIRMVTANRSFFETLAKSVAQEEDVSTIYGWRMKPVKGIRNTFLVSWTCERKNVGEVGWWWEVNTASQTGRPVRWDKELERKYSVLESGKALPPGWQLLTREVTVLDMSRVDADSITIRSRGENGLEGVLVIPHSVRVIRQGQDEAFAVEHFKPGALVKITYTFSPFHSTHTAIRVEFAG